MASQNAIDELVISQYRSGGFFLEIGCWDGEHISQTANLEREHGWRGLCVDPFPKNFQKRTCQVLPVAISKDGLVREFVKVTIDRRHGGDVSYFSGFKDNLKAHWPLIEEHCDYTVVPVHTMAMSTLQQTAFLPSFVEFLSIDTEGSEIEILQSIDWGLNKFGIICFEHNADHAVRDEAREILKSAGYAYLTSTDIDDIYTLQHTT